ncbi:MAG: hypothetical protein ACUVUC_03095 [Thermoguttaceae bacterium]
MADHEHRWLAGLADSIWEWLARVRTAGRPGWVRFCPSGACLAPGPKAGLGASCLALKTCAMLGLTPRLPDGELHQWIAHIQGFQTPRGRFAGYFEDPSILRIADRQAGWFRRNVPIRRAETRQACAALLSVHSGPVYPITRLPSTPSQVRRYLRQLDWTRPWGAGSHAGHLLFFYGLGGASGAGGHDPELVEAACSELDRLQDPATGSWHRGQPPIRQIINGAMKVLTGYAFLNRPFRLAERLIDTCLASPSGHDGCDQADAVYVLHQCAGVTNYRRAEIEGSLVGRLRAIRRLQRADGAFSFFPDRAQTHYYGVAVSRGLPESDVHGTTLLVWTLVMIGDLLGFRAQYGWRLPVT